MMKILRDMPMSQHWTAALLLGAAVATPACGGDFDPYNRLSALRILAIQSDPVAPASGETTTLTPLIFTPTPDQALTYQWSWCPLPGTANDGYPCRLTEAELAGLAGPGLPAYSLGTGPTTMFKHAFDPALLQRLCAPPKDPTTGDAGLRGGAVPDAAAPSAAHSPGGAVPALLNCEGGFPVQIKLVVKTASDEITAVTTLRLLLDTQANANSNPSIEGLLVMRPLPRTADDIKANKPVAFLPPERVGDEPLVVLPRKVKTILNAEVPENARDFYNGSDDTGAPVVKRERFSLSWFVQTGDTKSARTGIIEGVPIEKALKNEWEPGKASAYAQDTARLIVVIRDDRGGVGWRSATVKLGPTP